MKKALLLAVALSASGCATKPVEQLAALDICYALATGRTGMYDPSHLAYEIRQRGEDCNRYRDMMAIRAQADARRSAALQSASEYFLRQSQPRPQINCTTFRNGPFTNTQCN